jgi:putative methyltransferase
MKTAQAAVNAGLVIAIERSGKRFKILKQLLAKHVPIKDRVQAVQRDFLKLNPQDYPQIEYIICDPTCSGSGLVENKSIDQNNGGDEKKDNLEKLANFQTMILKHALKFPKVKKVAYSTCSINREENENVVLEVLSDVTDKFRLAPNVLSQWERRGLDGLKDVIRVNPEDDLATGFFVAVFERI